LLEPLPRTPQVDLFGQHRAQAISHARVCRPLHEHGLGRRERTRAALSTGARVTPTSSTMAPLSRGPLGRRRVLHRFVDDPERKRCGRCTQWLALDRFSKSRAAWDGLQGVCRDCQAGRGPESPGYRRSEHALINGADHKRCGSCRKMKPASGFNRRAASRDGLAAKCRAHVTGWHPVDGSAPTANGTTRTLIDGFRRTQSAALRSRSGGTTPLPITIGSGGRTTLIASAPLMQPGTPQIASVLRRTTGRGVRPTRRPTANTPAGTRRGDVAAFWSYLMRRGLSSRSLSVTV